MTGWARLGCAALLAVMLGAAAGGVALGDDRVVTMTTLEWPPYTGQALQGQGASVVAAREAFAAMGYELCVLFYPWRRAMAEALRNEAVAGYFPEYDDPAAARDFIFSDPIGVSPLGFAERLADPVVWSSLDDLAGMRIGTVAGYVNTTAFDAMAAAGTLSIDPASEDAINLQKLARGRIRLAVMDYNVFRYLSAEGARKRVLYPKLAFNARLLENKKLYLCFRKGPEGERLARIFNEGLRRVDADALHREYMHRVFGQDRAPFLPAD